MIADPTDKVRMIAYLVEKATKGIRKQLRGYVKQTQEEIEYSKRHVYSRIEEFERLYKSTHEMKKDWAALEMMLKENEQMKKMMFQMRMLHEEVRNELMDMRLLNIELKQKLQGK